MRNRSCKACNGSGDAAPVGGQFRDCETCGGTGRPACVSCGETCREDDDRYCSDRCKAEDEARAAEARADAAREDRLMGVP